MDERLVVVSAVGGDIGYNVARALSSNGFRIVGIDCRTVDNIDGIFDEIVTVSASAHEDAYLSEVIELLESKKADFFVPVSEPELLTVSRSAHRFDALSTRLVINRRNIVETFSNKYETAMFLRRHGLPHPKTFMLADYAGELGFPLVVKPVRGCGSKRVWVVEDDDDLDYLTRKNDGTLIVQELVGTSDQEYTTGVFSDGKTTRSITFKRILGFGGLTVAAELCRAGEMDSLAEVISARCSLFGSINIQTRRVDGRFIPFEINPRFSSTLPIRIAFGFNDARWWLRCIEGKGFAYAPTYRTGRVVRRITEHYFDLK